MRTTIRKWFWAWDFDKEEKWLNDMAAQGKTLLSVRCATYEFEDTQPRAYSVRLEMLAHRPDSDEGKKYIQFLEETGAEYLGSVVRWVYFRKRTDMGVFELYSDAASRVKHLKRIMALFVPLFCYDTYVALYNLMLYVGNGLGISLFAGLTGLAAAGLLGYGIYRLNEKKKRLEKESQLFE